MGYGVSTFFDRFVAGGKCLTGASYSGLIRSNCKHQSCFTRSSIISALQVGSIMNGDLVEVLSCTDNWAEVTYNGKKGYVSARYLKAYIPSDECAVPDIDDDKLFGYQTYIFLYEKMPYVILGLSILLLLLARTPLCSTLLVLMGVAELLFVAGIMAPGHGEMVWFGDPNEVGCFMPL